MPGPDGSSKLPSILLGSTATMLVKAWGELPWWRHGIGRGYTDPLCMGRGYLILRLEGLRPGYMALPHAGSLILQVGLKMLAACSGLMLHLLLRLLAGPALMTQTWVVEGAVLGSVMCPVAG